MALFQFGGYGGGMFGNLLYQLEYWGVRDVILPFVLIFTIFYAVLQRIDLFASRDAHGNPKPGTGKKYNVVLSLAIALLVVIPHALNAYPPGADVVNIINDSIPNVALLTVTVVLLLMMLGLGSGKAVYKNWIVLGSCVILALIFLSAMWPVPFLTDFLYALDPGIQALIIILLVFGIIVGWITKDEGDKGGMEKFWEWLGKAPGT